METTAGVRQQSGFVATAADNFQHTQNTYDDDDHDLGLHVLGCTKQRTRHADDGYKKNRLRETSATD